MTKNSSCSSKDKITSRLLHSPPITKTPRENKNLLKRDPSLPHLHYHLGKNHAICKLGQEGESRKRGKVRESEPGRGSAG